ncbi:hypothetical protein ACO2Q3_10865 [Caulobacter sp. KR2-114]|uniref:hypothetical protein n=1 Tax=Caulobacter sp. KR2-114 TaxID=3400912 RepID=UPI003C005331
MAVFPKIQSPCPYKSQLAEVMQGDFCRMCKRQVVALDAMSDGERVAFLSACQDEVCVSYRLPVGIAVAAATAAAALATPLAAAAQDATPATIDVLVIGGIKDPANVKFIEHADAAPALPTVYEDAPAAVATTQAAKALPAPVTAPAKAPKAS